ncbi:MAG: hypothetical protein QCH35_10440 [Methanomicrobiaceae archaeon]|nr:hypothetical protein [Methanomicrobiaceae archaeon]
MVDHDQQGGDPGILPGEGEERRRGRAEGQRRRSEEPAGGR